MKLSDAKAICSMATPGFVKILNEPIPDDPEKDELAVFEYVKVFTPAIVAKLLALWEAAKLYPEAALLQAVVASLEKE